MATRKRLNSRRSRARLAGGAVLALALSFGAMGCSDDDAEEVDRIYDVDEVEERNQVEQLLDDVGDLTEDVGNRFTDIGESIQAG